jgi:outer membrane protein assembly factor BamB
MRHLFGLLVLAAVLAPAFPQQMGVRVYTTPRGLSPEALNRLNLALAWRARVPTEGSCDGLLSVQLVPGVQATGYQVLVQTLRGFVVALDPETGVAQWRTFVGGRPFELGRPFGFNSKWIIAVRGQRMYVLDRRTGATYPYAPDPDSGKLIYGHPLLGVPAAAPAADEDAVFISFGKQFYAFLLPHLGEEPPAREGQPTPKKVEASAPVRFIWGAQTDAGDVLEPPVVTPGYLGLVTDDGIFLSGTKFDFDKVVPTRVQLDGAVRVPMSIYGDIAYVATDEGVLYAMLVSGRILWRAFEGSPILYRPQVTDDDVFLTSARGGLARINRRDREVRAPGRDRVYQGGQLVWRNPEARRFLATNDRFVYAADRLNRLLVLDYDRGTLLARFDTIEWNFPVSNPWSDRFFLAAQDGQVLCLHHRDSKTPVITKKVELIKPPEKKKEAEEEKKDEAAPPVEPPPVEKKPEPPPEKNPAEPKGGKMPGEKQEDMKKEDMKKGAVGAGPRWERSLTGGMLSRPILVRAHSQRVPGRESMAHPSLDRVAVWRRAPGNFL